VREIVVFGGSAHPALTAEICAFLAVPQQPVQLQRFANDCLEVQLQANCRERDVFLIQPLVYPVQEHLVELLLMADAARGASAARVTAVIPHYAYARSDKKDKPRISIGGRLVADLLVTAGVDRVLTLTLHSPQVHGFVTTVFELLDRLREQGVRSVAVACTHGLFADNALDKLTAAEVTEVVCTNSAPVPADYPKLHVLSVAPALAEAISRIHNGESVSALFNH
jgi:phosphoribosylpyrophosphate synthetase